MTTPPPRFAPCPRCKRARSTARCICTTLPSRRDVPALHVVPSSEAAPTTPKPLPHAITLEAFSMPPDAKSPTLSPQTQFKLSLAMLVTVAAALVGLGVTYASLPKRDELGALGRDLTAARQDIATLKTMLEERDRQHGEALKLLREEVVNLRNAQQQAVTSRRKSKPLP